jgi:hypothetical protein
MSAISSFPNEVLAEIFEYIPASDVVTNCRAVCKNWNAATCGLGLWQKIATLTDIEIDPTAQVKDIEIAVRDCLLRRRIVVSTEEKLKEKFIHYFSNIPEGETRALCYRSVSKPEAIGFFIKTKNSELASQFFSGKYGSVDTLKKLFPTLQGLLIMAKDKADYVDGVLCASSSHIGAGGNAVGHIVGLHHKLLKCEYFLSDRLAK